MPPEPQPHPNTSPAPPPPATRVGKYLMFDLLGEGAFGKVRLAVDQTTGKQYAIKIMHKSHIHQHELTLQVRREIAVMKAMNHPYIVNLYEVLNSSKNLYMVMDLVTGGELFDAVAQRGRLPESTARLYFQQLVDGIHYCHTRRVYHRDLKPENLLLSADRKTLKITDFGLSSIKLPDASSELLHTVMGSPHYIAPEIITSAATGYEGAKVDVWASGIILYGMLAGFLPFDEPDTRALYQAIVQTPPQFPKHFSYDVVKLLRAMLQKDPAKRPTMDLVKQYTWFKVDYQPVMSDQRRPASHSSLRKERRKHRVRRSIDRARHRNSTDHAPLSPVNPSRWHTNDDDTAQYTADSTAADFKQRKSIASTASSASGSSAGHTSDTSAKLHRSHWFDKPLQSHDQTAHEQVNPQHVPTHVPFEDSTTTHPTATTQTNLMGAQYSKYANHTRRRSIGEIPKLHPVTADQSPQVLQPPQRRHWFDLPTKDDCDANEDGEQQSASTFKSVADSENRSERYTRQSGTAIESGGSNEFPLLGFQNTNSQDAMKKTASTGSGQVIASTPTSSSSSLQAAWERCGVSGTPDIPLRRGTPAAPTLESTPEDSNGLLSSFAKMMLTTSASTQPSPHAIGDVKSLENHDPNDGTSQSAKIKPSERQLSLSKLASPLSTKSETPFASRSGAQQLDISKISGAIFSPFNSPMQMNADTPSSSGLFAGASTPTPQSTDGIFKPMTPQFAALAEATTDPSRPTMAPSVFCPEVGSDDGETGLTTWCIDSMDVFADVESDGKDDACQTAINTATNKDSVSENSREQVRQASHSAGSKSIFSPLSHTMRKKLSRSELATNPSKPFNLSLSVSPRTAN